MRFYGTSKELIVSLFRAILCIVFPPLAVLDRGCGTLVIVTLLTIAGWIPGALAALVLNYQAAQIQRVAYR
jgi:uncharacterized membrane protein YqaE (UPF0057 family)